MANTAYSQEYPFGAPTVSGSNITVDMMLAQPTRINAYLSDLALKNYFANRIFSNGGGLSGGALIYSQLTANDLFPTRGVQKVVPGAEFPEVTFDRPTPLTKQVEKYGGKFPVTDEARDRNDMGFLRNEADKLSNDIVRTIHAVAIAELEAAITAFSSDLLITGTSWADAAALTLTTTANNILPTADFATVNKKAAQTELGVTYNLWIVNPQELANFQVVYGDRWRAVLDAWNMDMIASNQVTAGTAYVVEEGRVGQQRTEKPLSTVTFRKEEIQSTYVQSDIRVLYAVTNPYSALKVQGLAA